MNAILKDHTVRQEALRGISRRARAPPACERSTPSQHVLEDRDSHVSFTGTWRASATS